MKSAASAARFDWPLAVAVVAITALGMLNLHSATHASRPQLYLQQVTWIGVGVLAFLAAAALAIVSLRFAPAHRRHAASLPCSFLAALSTARAAGSAGGLRSAVGVREAAGHALIARFVTDACARGLRHRTSRPTAIAAVPVALILRSPIPAPRSCYSWSSTLMLLAGLRLRSIVTLAVLAIVAAPLTWSTCS